MLFIALSVAGCAGYFSVWGLSQLFAGASTAVIIMASILEIGKIVTTTALHQYWNKLAISLKTYLTISVVVLMLITSAGIYGFLSNAYQKTANKLEIHEGEVAMLDSKKQLLQKTIYSNEKIIDTKNKRLDQLSNLRNLQENRVDLSKSNRSKDKARNDIQNANNDIKTLSLEIDDLTNKNAVLSDSIGNYDIKILQLKASSSIAGEVGPLKYISELTHIEMNKVVNFLILLLIFVFDPLAIALIITTNKAFNKEDDKQIIESKELEPIDELPIESETIVEEKPEILEPINPEPEVVKSEIIEQPIRQKKEPVIPTGRIEVDDIKEIKEGHRGYSVSVPPAKSNNSIERIGTNKVVKNGDANKVYFKR